MKFEQRDLGDARENSTGERARFSTVQLIIGTIVMVATVYLFAFTLTLVGTRFIPDSWEAAFGNKADFSKRLGTPDTPKDDALIALRKRARSTFDIVYKAWQATSDLPQRNLNISFDVIDMKQAGEPVKNAFALPGGAVFITKALAEAVTEETALALVIAHEIAHVERRHVLQNIGLSLTNSILLSIVFGGSDFDAGSWIDSVGQSSFSRSREHEADTDGIRIVQKAYGHTKNALQFFKLIEKEEADKPQIEIAFLRSHPVTADRIAYLTDMQNKLATAQPENSQRQ